MQSKDIMGSILSLSLCLFLGTCSFSLWLMAFSPELRYAFSQFVVDGTDWFFQAALWSFGMFLICSLGCYVARKKRVFYFKMGAHPVSVDLCLIEKVLGSLLMNPKVRLASKQQLEIEIENSSQDVCLQLEQQIAQLLYTRFGYLKPFFLVVRSNSVQPPSLE